MKKQAAFTILATMVLIPFLVWGGNKLVDHGERLSVVETKEENTKELLDKMDKKLDTLLLIRNNN